MKLFHSMFVLLLLLQVAGCRNAPEQRAMLTQYEHELRRYEDLIYDLEYEYDILSNENERLKEKLSEQEGDAPKRATSPQIIRPRDNAPSEQTRKPSVKSQAEDDELLAPEIDMGSMQPMTPPIVPRASTSETPPAAESVPEPLHKREPEIPATPLKTPALPNLESPVESIPPPRRPLLPGPSNTSTPAVEQETLPAPKFNAREQKTNLPELLPTPGEKVSQLWIDSQETSGVNTDQRLGDDALKIVFQPLNAQGNAIVPHGKVTVVVLDPAKTGEHARIGKWEWNATEVRQQALQSGGKKLALEIPWQNQYPENSELALFIRYETPQGERVEKQHNLQVQLPGQQLVESGWTARPRRTSEPQQAANKHPAEPVMRAEHTAETSAVQPARLEVPVEIAKPHIQKPEWKPMR
jgi:hypothetical protein